jgi:hypothetical protein
MREAEQATNLPVYSRRQLGQARIAVQILETARLPISPTSFRNHLRDTRRARRLRRDAT